MEKLRIQPNTVDSDASKSDLYPWCAPRKTKAVSSTGEIFIDVTSNSKVEKKKSRKRTKTEKIHSKVFRSKKRINELARPRQKVFESSQNSPQNIKNTELSSNSKLSLTNFGINEKTTNLKTISTQEWMERINKLAEPRVRESTPTNIIGKVAEKALLATASKRIIELAKKKPLTSADPHTKNGDPFKVNSQALKAICSKRTKSLAVPKIFKIHSHYCNTEKIVY